MQDKFKLSKKQDLDSIINLVRKGDWKAQEFLYTYSRYQCLSVCSKRNWTVLGEDLKEIINFSVGKAISKYEICGRYWGLLSIIFVHEVKDYFRSIYEEKGLGKRVNEETVHEERAEYDPTREEIRMQIEQALSMKPEEQKKCIQLDLEGYNDERIKSTLGKNKSIKDLKYHAKMNLKRVLISNFGWEPK